MGESTAEKDKTFCGEEEQLVRDRRALHGASCSVGFFFEA